MTPTISPAGEGRQIRVGPNTITYRTTAAESDGRIGVIDYRAGPGFVAPSVLHWHTKESWTGYLFEGRLRFRFSDGATAEAGPGDVIHVPVRTPFAWENASADQPAHILFMYTPGGFENYFSDIADLFAANPGKPVPDLLTQIMEIAAKYGIES